MVPLGERTSSTSCTSLSCVECVVSWRDLLLHFFNQPRVLKLDPSTTNITNPLIGHHHTALTNNVVVDIIDKLAWLIWLSFGMVSDIRKVLKSIS
jgi:hypothetical protein